MNVHMYIYLYLCIYIDRESNHGEKKCIFEKYFRLMSLSFNCIFISSSGKPKIKETKM